MDPQTQSLAITAMLAAPIAWAAVQGLKPLLKSARPGAAATSTALWHWFLRCLSVAIGGAVGYFLNGERSAILAGAAGGALSGFIVAALKSEARKIVSRSSESSNKEEDL